MEKDKGSLQCKEKISFLKARNLLLSLSILSLIAFFYDIVPSVGNAENDHNEKINENNVVDYNLSLC